MASWRAGAVPKRTLAPFECTRVLCPLSEARHPSRLWMILFFWKASSDVSCCCACLAAWSTASWASVGGPRARLRPRDPSEERRCFAAAAVVRSCSARTPLHLQAVPSGPDASSPQIRFKPLRCNCSLKRSVGISKAELVSGAFSAFASSSSSELPSSDCSAAAVANWRLASTPSQPRGDV